MRLVQAQPLVTQCRHCKEWRTCWYARGWLGFFCVDCLKLLEPNQCEKS